MKKLVWMFGLVLTIFLLSACSSGNAQEAQEAQTEQEAQEAQTAQGAVEDGTTEVPAVVLDIPTTQSFTEEAVSAEDAEAILLAGINAPSAMNGQPWHFSAVTDRAVLEKIAGDMSAGMPRRMPASDGAGEAAPGVPPAGDGAGEAAPGMPPAGDSAGEAAPGVPSAGDGAGEAMPSMPPAGGSAKAGVADAPLAIVISCRDGSELDAGLACQTMSIAAALMGYGTKIVTSPTIALNGENQAEYKELLGIPEEYTAAAVLLIGRTGEAVDAATSATTRKSTEEVVSWITP